jgi:subtilisin family serine protease
VDFFRGFLMAKFVQARGRFSLRHKLLCSALAFTVALPTITPAHAALLKGNAYTTTLQDLLAKDPAHFNERMWDLIRANPEAREQIFMESIRLSLQHEIAVQPGKKAEILARFQKLYPEHAGTLEAFAEGADTASPTVLSFKDTSKVRTYATDPEHAANNHTSWMGRNWPWVLLGGAAVVGGTVAIVAAGSSSSSSSTTTPILIDTPPSVGAAQELANQSGLGRINAAAANDAGFTGKDIIVGVIDSGVNVNHPDLRDNIAPGGYNYIDHSSVMRDTNNDPLDGVFHGTHVAGIIAAAKNDFGIRGVAYNAKILPLAAIGSGGTYGDIRDAQDLGAKVINGSYGADSATVDLFVQKQAYLLDGPTLALADTYLNYANHGGILVFSAGNSYDVYQTASSPYNIINSSPISDGFLPFIRPANKNIALGQPGAYRVLNNSGTLSTIDADYSALEGHLIVVAALKENNTIANFSNRCGVAKDWCISAPGVNITSTGAGSTYSALDGTSFSAPHVSGALAVLLEQHPELTPAQIVNLLLTTATDIGDPGVDDLYGHGLLNLGAAIQSVGPFSVVTGLNMSGNQVLLSNSSVRSSAAFGSSFVNKLSSTEIGVLDSYTRNFTVSLGQVVKTTLSSLDSTSALQRFGQQEFRPTVAIDESNSASFTVKAKNGLERAAAGSDAGSTFDSYSFTHQLGEAVALNVNHRDARANALGFNESDRTLLSSQVSASGVGNPYLDFVSEGYANNVTTDLPWEGRFRATTAMGAPNEDKGQRNMVAMAEVGFGNDNTGISLTSGALIEQERLLGLQGTGAFELGHGATTWFAGIAGRWQVASKTQLLASAYGGMTESSAANNSLVSDIGRVTTSSWRIGLTQADVLQDDDHLRLNIAQPLRAESGAMQLNLPQYRLRDGTVIQQGVEYSLAPSGREIDLEAGYSFAVDNTTKLDFAAMFRRDAGHVAGKNEAVGLTRVNHNF